MQPGFFPANIIFIVIFAVFLGFFLYTAWQLYRMMRLGQPEDRFDAQGRRFGGVLSSLLGQRFVIREPSGWGHFFIFFGFLVLTIGTIETFGVGIHHDFAYWKIFGRGLTGLLYLLQDFFSVAVLIAIVVGVYRRFIMKPLRLESDNTKSTNLEAGFILLLIWVLVMLLFAERGVEYHLARLDSGRYFPDLAFVSIAVSGPFAGLSDSSLHNLFSVFWWAHTVVILVFLVYIPRSKHLHLLGAIPNIFFQRHHPYGRLSKLDLEDETAETYGVSQIEQFTCKQLLDLYACTECGRCTENCPATLTGKPLNPKLTIHHLKEHLMEQGKLLLSQGAKPADETAEASGGGDSDGKKLIGDTCLTDELWSCTACGNCMEHCPVQIEHVDKYVDMRRHLVLMESNFPTEAGTAFRNWESNSNPWGFGSATRADWTEELNVPTVSENPEFEYLFYVGCAGSFDARSRNITVSLVKLLQAAGVNFAILGADEKCCGETARRMGNEYLFQMMAAELVEILNGAAAKKIITTCPHCFNTLKNEYPAFEGNWEIIHHSELLADLVRSGRLQPTGAVTGKLAFHDSCYLGRYNEVYDQPRRVLESIPSLKLTEMDRCGDKSFCCGAGGGRMWMEETLGDMKINEARTDQALAKKPDMIGVCCHYCTTMLEDGLKSRNMEENVKVLDIAELLAQSVKID